MDENEKFIGFIANSYEFRSKALQSPTVTIQNVVGPTPLRLLMLSQKPSLLGVPIKRYFSYFEPDADIKRRLLIMKQVLHFRMEGLGIILHKIQNTVIIINKKEVAIIQS